MPERVENPETTKLEDETVLNESAEEKVERIAEKAAEKSTKAVQRYDKDHTIFSN